MRGGLDVSTPRGIAKVYHGLHYTLNLARNLPSVPSILQADGSAFPEKRILLSSNWAWSLSRQPLPIVLALPSSSDCIEAIPSHLPRPLQPHTTAA